MALSNEQLAAASAALSPTLGAELARHVAHSAACLGVGADDPCAVDLRSAVAEELRRLRDLRVGPTLTDDEIARLAIRVAVALEAAAVRGAA